MTLSTTVSRVQYPGAGSVGPYAFPFRIQQAADLLVTKRNAAGVEQVLVNPTHYSVGGVGNPAGTVLLVTALAAGETLVIRRAPPLTQTTSIRNQGTYFPATIEDEFDRLVMQIQSLQDQLQRAPRYRETSDPTLLSMTLVGEAGKVLGWDSATLLTNKVLDSSAVALPGAGRTVATLSAYLANNSVFNAKDFGAVGNGVADDTAALQDFLDDAYAAGARYGYLPAGTYLTGQLNWPGNEFALVGAGPGHTYGSVASVASVLKAKAGTTAVINQVITGVLGTDRTNSLVANIHVNGNLLATYGVKTSEMNTLENVRVTGCLTAGVLLANNTNSCRLIRCTINNNFTDGLKIEGSSTTPFFCIDSKFSLNNRYGINAESGFGAFFIRCIIESNGYEGARIYRPNTHAGSFGNFDFYGCWFEDNGKDVASTRFSVSIDSQTATEFEAPSMIRFHKCRFSASADNNRKYINFARCNWVTIDQCNFNGTNNVNALTATANARFVRILRSAKTEPYPAAVNKYNGISDAQMDAFVAAGHRCYHVDEEVTTVAPAYAGLGNITGSRRYVGPGLHVAFAGAWANLGGAHAPMAFYFAENGDVCLQGHIAGGAGTIFTLPAGYRPAFSHYFTIWGNDAFAAIEVAPTGIITFRAGSNVSVSLNGLRFATG